MYLCTNLHYLCARLHGRCCTVYAHVYLGSITCNLCTHLPACNHALGTPGYHYVLFLYQLTCVTMSCLSMHLPVSYHVTPTSRRYTWVGKGGPTLITAASLKLPEQLLRAHVPIEWMTGFSCCKVTLSETGHLPHSSAQHCSWPWP